MTDMETIQISGEQIEGFKIDEHKCRQLCGKILSLLHLAGYELSIEFLDSEQIAELNSEYRDKQTPTDVLSFPQLEFAVPLELGAKPKHDGFHKILGDIVICPDVCAANAKMIGQGIDREACFLLIHGILHLCGHDHIEPADETKMLAQQNAIMSHLVPEDWQGILGVDL